MGVPISVEWQFQKGANFLTFGSLLILLSTPQSSLHLLEIFGAKGNTKAQGIGKGSQGFFQTRG